MTVTASEITGKDGINTCKALFEHHGHLVQEISSSADHGEDLLVVFTKGGNRTGDSVYVQVKSGPSYKRKTDYFIPTKGHIDFWRKSNAPVFGVVYDPDTKSLYWTNITGYVQAKDPPARIPVGPTSVLSDSTMSDFVDEAIEYIAKKGNLHKALSALVGVDAKLFDYGDYVSYFVNEFGEKMVFQQKVGNESAVLYHTDALIDSPVIFRKTDIKIDYSLFNPDRTYVVGNWILGTEEFGWLVASMKASNHLTRVKPR